MSNEVMDREVVIMNEINPSNLTPGAFLRFTRENLGLTLEEVALQMHLSPVVVDALENDAMARLPGVTFVRGYLRAYAKILSLPADEVIAAFNAIYPQTAQSFTAPATTARRTQKMVIKKKRSNEKLVRWIGYIIAAVLVVLVFTWWHNHTTMMDEALSHQAAKPLPATEIAASTVEPTDATATDTIPAAATTPATSAAAMQPVGPASSSQSQMDVTSPIAATVANTAANVPGLQPTASTSPLTATPANKTVNATEAAANAAAVPGLAPTAPPNTPAKSRVAKKSAWVNPDAN
jgi:cytoskeleton protein RodZ